MVETRPYGTWDSPLQVDEIYKASSTLAELYVDDTTQEIYHVESRASEGGRSVLCKSLSPSKDLIGPSSNARTRVHEYGGSAATLRHGWAYYSDFVDGRVFRVKVGEDVGSVKAVTPESSVYRYADFAVHPQNPDLVLAIREDHTIDEPSKVVNALVVINAANKEVTVVVEGNDFYASPRWNNDGTKAAWIEWSHPDMPWEGATLYYASFKLEDEPKLTRSVEVAGKHNTVSVTQPLWGLGESKDKLFFASDETGYQNIWVVDTAQEGAEARLAMKQLDKDFTTPMWSLGTCDYALLDGKTGLVAPLNDRPTLSHFDLRSGKIVPIAGGEVYGKIDQLKRLSDTQAVFIGSKSDAPATLVIVTLGSSAGQADFSEAQTTKPEHLKKPVDPAYASRPETYTLRVPWNENAKRPEGMSEDTKEVDLHVILFPPTNPKFKAPEGTRPPCLVGVHGGPTSQAFPVHNTFYQYFTSRGFAVLDVNYGGSSGYGRQYMQRLSSNWGIVDVHDTVHAVSKLAEMGKIDGEKVGIRGGSAGGFTTLACLTDSRVFSVGISLYGVSDIKLLVADTHKFESQYMFKLVGGTPEQVPQVYHDRSPLYKAANIRAATLILQGNDDKIVPPSQAHEIIKRIEEGGHGQVESVFYDGEGHGFRKLENLKDSLIRTEAFLKKTFGLSEE